MGSRSGPFTCSLAIHASLALLLSAIRFAAPVVLRPHESVYLAPPPAKRAPASVVRPRLQTPPPKTFPAPASASLRLPAQEAIPAPRPPVLAPEIAQVETPPPVMPTPPPLAPLRTVEHQPSITTGTFSDAIPAQNAEHAASKVQVGSFESAPSNSAAGARGSGARALIATGFDTPTADGRAARARSVQASGFTELALAAAPAARKTPAPRGRETALEILRKPRPIYSDAARRLGLEGDVLLEAAFTASGQVHVLRVLRGLGHGLDENAIIAAAGIHYRAATVNGAPVDTVATVRITFQLAN